jgi:ATP-dependent Clp protease ATP-binding subunit ClpA
MFERFTEKARRTIFFARYEASQFGSKAIEPSHLLLGLLREGRDMFAAVGKSGVGGAVRLALAIRALQKPAAEKIPTSVELPLSDSSARALAFAAEEAERVKSRFIDLAHLLAGLLRVLEDDKSAMLGALNSLGVTLESVRGFALESNLGERALDKLVSNDELAKLLARIPEARRGAASRLLEGLCGPNFSATGVDSRGPFTISFGPYPDPRSSSTG